MKTNIDLLLEGCKQNDEKCQMQLYDTYCQAMYNVVCRYVKDSEDAKDVMQEGFLKAFLNMDTYQTNSSFGAWLKRIMINQSIDYLKKKRLELVNESVEHIQLVDSEDWNFSVEITKAQILDAIETLSEHHKLVVKLYLLEGYDHEEISEILDIPMKTSRTHLRRGRLKLQDVLKTKRYGARY